MTSKINITAVDILHILLVRVPNVSIHAIYRNNKVLFFFVRYREIASTSGFRKVKVVFFETSLRNNKMLIVACENMP